MTNAEKIQALIAYLEATRDNPLSSIGSIDPMQTALFINSVNRAAYFLVSGAGQRDHEQLRMTILHERGWETDVYVWESMQAQNLDDTAIVTEMLTLEILAYQQLLDLHGADPEVGTDEERLAHVQSMVEDARLNPAFYVGKPTPANVHLFLRTFAATCAALGFGVVHQNHYEVVAQEYGILIDAENNALGTLLARWLSASAVVDRLFQIEIEAWQRHLPQD